MKTRFRFFFPILAAVAALAAAPSFAAEPDLDVPAQPERPGLERLAERLDLTDAQKAAIGPILENEAAQLRALRDSPGPRLKKARRFRQITGNAQKQIRQHLTPVQQEEFDRLIDEMRARAKERWREQRSGQERS